MSGSGKQAEKKRSSKLRPALGLAVGGLVLAAASAAWLLFRPQDEPPEILLKTAFEQLDHPNDPEAWESARRIAERILESGYRAPEFLGAAEFILGIAESRTAQSDGDSDGKNEAAVASLRAAERQGLDESRRPEWSFALGTSLFALKRFETARPLLEESWWAFPGRDEKVRSGLALAEIELERPGEDSIVSIDQVLAELSAGGDLSPPEKRRLAIIRAKVALRNGKTADAGLALEEIESHEPTATDVSLLRAEILLAEGRLDEARKRLIPLAGGEDRSGRTHAALAAYLLGRCERERGDAAAAGRAFEHAADLAPPTDDGVRGALAAAAILQEAGRDEEAFSLFRRAISSQAQGDPPPIPEEEIRRSVRAGWETWAAHSAFDRAVSLAAAAEPVLGRVESLRLQARGRERSAATAEEAWKTAKNAEQRAGVTARNDRWKESGAAYRNLADAVTDSSEVGDALSTAAEHFSRGRAFEDADAALTDLLDLRLSRLEAAVLARRGQVRLDLGKPDLAAEDFRAIVDRHPTAPEAFQSRFLLGRCHLERGDSGRAEEAWRDLLALNELTPDAAEWRLALFALADLLHRRGAAALTRSERGGTNQPADPAAQADAVAALDEAIARFGEYILRASDSERIVEARVLRADAMRRRAEIALTRAAEAETESLRDVHARESERLLTAAVAELRQVQAKLSPLDDAGRLPELGQELLKTAAFDLGHAYASSGRHQEAVVAYGAAVNRYPDDARVLPAYLRMADCYRRLHRTEEARAAVEQARLVLAQLPAPALSAGSTLTRDDWETWLARARDLGGAAPIP